MKKISFILLSLLLSFTFILSGCNLFVEDKIENGKQIAVQAGEITLTKEELVKGYNNYYSTFYNQNQGDATAAMSDLIEYLVSKKIYISDAKKLIEENKIELSDAEKNYIWYSVYTALINNIETFEEKVKKELDIKDEDEEELEKEENFVYTPYDKIANIIFNETTGEYEISIIKTALVETVDDEGEKIYKYVPVEESKDYTVSELFNSVYIKNLVNEKKLYLGKNDLTEEESFNKTISKESIRRYINQLKENEKGKNLSTDDESVFEREIERIYNIVYENLLVNKLYVYKVSQIDVSEEEVLNRYIEKVKGTYERYLLDEKAFTTELTKTVREAKQYGSYSTPSKSIEDIFYIPENDSEKFFYLTHIVISFSEEQVQKINERKQYCEANGIDLEDDEEYKNIIDKSKIMLDERDKEGYIVVKKTDDNAISVADMFENLETDMDKIYDKYYSTVVGSEGLITLQTDLKIIKRLEIEYQNERADKFNEYIYKYSDDGGTLQIQKTYFGDTNENWYTYALGTDKTTAGFVENFVEEARNLFNNGTGEITDFNTILMQDWSEKDGVKTLNAGSTGYSIMMYCGEVKNHFESFDEQKFTLEDLLREEGSNGKYYSLVRLDYYRLGLTMNKTFFDLIFEECYDKAYDEIIKVYEDSVLDGINIITHKNVYKELLG